MLGERGEEHVPPLVAGARRLLGDKRLPVGGAFVPVLLQELREEAPPVPVIVRLSEVSGEIDQRW